MVVKSVSIRIEEAMLEKLAYIADYEARSVNSQILVLIRDSIKEFEQIQGSINGASQCDLNVKPTRKSKNDD